MNFGNVYLIFAAFFRTLLSSPFHSGFFFICRRACEPGLEIINSLQDKIHSEEKISPANQIKLLKAYQQVSQNTLVFDTSYGSKFNII